MTMPSEIWVDNYNWEPITEGWNKGNETRDPDLFRTQYIRADIAEELARALDMAQIWLSVDGRFDMQGINAALTRYNAIAP